MGFPMPRLQRCHRSFRSCDFHLCRLWNAPNRTEDKAFSFRLDVCLADSYRTIKISVDGVVGSNVVDRLALRIVGGDRRIDGVNGFLPDVLPVYEHHVLLDAHRVDPRHDAHPVDLDPEDRTANELALQSGGRIFSAYTLATTAQQVWVITEADRSTTTLLLPSEY